jgi:hypothetical protein
LKLSKDLGPKKTCTHLKEGGVKGNNEFVNVEDEKILDPKGVHTFEGRKSQRK